MSTDEVVRFEAVRRAYNEAPALDGIDLTIRRGEFVALVGASGSGKSTLLRLVNRLDEPDFGRVFVEGRNVADMNPIVLRRSIGYVLQHIGLFPHMTVAENVALLRRLAGSDRLDIAAALMRVGLPKNYAERMPAQLSGGEQQRVGIARALAGEGAILLMDEPFGALDPVTRDQLGRTVRDLHGALRLTTVMVTHDTTEALLLADRIIVLSAGQVVADATPAELYQGKAGRKADALIAVSRTQVEQLAMLGP